MLHPQNKRAEGTDSQLASNHRWSPPAIMERVKKNLMGWWDGASGAAALGLISTRRAVDPIHGHTFYSRRHYFLRLELALHCSLSVGWIFFFWSLMKQATRKPKNARICSTVGTPNHVGHPHARLSTRRETGQCAGHPRPSNDGLRVLVRHPATSGAWSAGSNILAHIFILSTY